MLVLFKRTFVKDPTKYFTLRYLLKLTFQAEFVIVEFQEQISWESLKANCWLYIKAKRRPNRTGDTLRLLLHYNLTMTTVLYKAIKNHLLSVTVLLASVSFHLDIYQLWWLQKCLHTEQRKGFFFKTYVHTNTEYLVQNFAGFSSQRTTQITVTRDGRSLVFILLKWGDSSLFLSPCTKMNNRNVTKMHDMSKK